jgi:hypothetical protein
MSKWSAILRRKARRHFCWKAKADFEAGRFQPLDEVLAGVGSKRGDPSGRKNRA